MAANYLHGAEVIEVTKGARPIRVVKSAVIALVGIAPNEYGQNSPTLILSPRDAANYGDMVPGFTIPQALNAYFQQGACTVVVTNVFNATTHTSNVSLESHVVADRAVKLSYAPIGTISIFQSDGTTSAGLVKDTDYVVDSYGNIKFISTGGADGTTLKFTYKKLNAAAVTDSAIIGTINGTTGARTGLECFDLAPSTFGFACKIFDAPGFSHDEDISAAMIVKANKFKGVALVNAPSGTTVSGAIAGRGAGGSIPAFRTSSDRALLCYPMVKAYDPATDGQIDYYLSQYLAGVISRVHNDEGYHVSPSNHEIYGVTGMERYISAAIDDPTCEANLLNEAGIITVFNGFGTGFRIWGNRSAAFPTVTTPNNFYSVRATADVINESVIQAMLQFIDKPINNATIDAIRGTVNDFLRTLYARNAIVDGKCTFSIDKNPTTEVALGHLTFDVEFMPPTPAERLTFESFINIALLASLK